MVRIKIYFKDGGKIRTRSVNKLLEAVLDPQFDSATIVHPVKFPLIVEKDEYFDMFLAYQANYDPDVAARHYLVNAFTPPKYFNSVDELKEYVAKFVSEP